MRGVEETFKIRNYGIQKMFCLTKSAGNPSAFFRLNLSIQASKMAFAHAAKAFIAINNRAKN